MVLLSPDGSLVYTDVCSNCSISTSTDQVKIGAPQFGSINLAMSSDGSSLANDKFYFTGTATLLHANDVWGPYSQAYLSGGADGLPPSIALPASYEICGEKATVITTFNSLFVVRPRSDSLEVNSIRVPLPFSLVSPDTSATPPFVAALDVLVTTNQQGVYLVLLPTGGVAKVDLSSLIP